MARKRKKLLSRMDVGRWVEFYAAQPYGHHKTEVYGLFVAVLACLRRPLRVLDLGAGPGHLALEFYKAHPEAQVRFTLLDSSERMLEVARQRLQARGLAAEAVHRSFNMTGWDDRLGTFDAVVSNNALFHVRPRRLAGFYRACFGLLGHDGIFLNQQSFAYEGRISPYGDDSFAAFVRALLPLILPAGTARSEPETDRIDREKAKAVRAHERAVACADAAGIEFVPGQTGYQFLSAEKHLDLMRRAGFRAGTIWRKCEFSVLLGMKGNPLPRSVSP